jgi:hypothetical protein
LTAAALWGMPAPRPALQLSSPAPPVPSSTAPVGRAAPAGTNPRRLPFWQGYTHARSYFEAPARRAMVAAAPRTAEPRAIASAARPQRAPGCSMPVQPLCTLRRVQGSRCTAVRRRAETWAGPGCPVGHTGAGRCCSSFEAPPGDLTSQAVREACCPSTQAAQGTMLSAAASMRHITHQTP